MEKKVTFLKKSPTFFMSVLPIHIFGKTRDFGLFENKGTIGRDIQIIKIFIFGIHSDIFIVQKWLKLSIL